MSTFYGECEICVASKEECEQCKDNGFTQTHFLSKEIKERCSDCACLVANEQGIWTCDSCNKPCMAVKICPEVS